MIPSLRHRARALAGVAAVVCAGCAGSVDATLDAGADGGRSISLALDAYTVAEVDAAPLSNAAAVHTAAPEALSAVLGTWYL